MQKFLAVDTAAAHLTVLACGKKTSIRFVENCALRQSVMLMGEVESAMEEAELAPAECDFFCAVTGPGSFTGIRIGISAAKGFALAEGKPLLPLTSFELIAYNVDCEDFFAVVDAAHGHSYACRFTGGAPGAPAYVSDEELVASGLPLAQQKQGTATRGAGRSPQKRSSGPFLARGYSRTGHTKEKGSASKDAGPFCCEFFKFPARRAAPPPDRRGRGPAWAERRRPQADAGRRGRSPLSPSPEPRPVKSAG